MEVLIENKEASVEGHIYKGTLEFNGERIWGPQGCHDSTVTLGQALQQADPRFSMTFEHNNHNIQKHTRSISVKDWHGNYLLSKLGTSENLESLVNVVMEKIKEAGPP